MISILFASNIAFNALTLNLATAEYAERPKFLDEQLECYYINEEQLPFVISPTGDMTNLDHFKTWAEAYQEELRALMFSQGAILLRGFPINSAEDFGEVVKSVIGRELIEYIGEGSRKTVAKGVYTSTEAPPEFKIPLHNELTCTINPVDYICFYCDIAPEPGTGQTIIGRTEDVTIEMMMRAHIWDLFDGKIMRYISRHPPEGNFFTSINPTHRTWPQVFNTDDRGEVERICKLKGYDYKWDGDWLEITRRVPAIWQADRYFDHPYWFNQLHLYHWNARIHGGWLNHVFATYIYITPSTRQYDITFDDGSPIAEEIVYEIYDILDEKTIKFDWEKGDALLLDNHKALHGRAPYVGQRRILVTMVQ